MSYYKMTDDLIIDSELLLTQIIGAEAKFKNSCALYFYAPARKWRRASYGFFNLHHMSVCPSIHLCIHPSVCPAHMILGRNVEQDERLCPLQE